jgi:hypothetical protein
MKSICLEIRDSMTFIPVMATSTDAFNEERDCFGSLVLPSTRERIIAQSYLLRRSGYPSDGSVVIVTDLNNPRRSSNDPYEWNDRTMQVSHKYIQENWSQLNNGDVIDVEFILGETTVKKVSERFET